MSSTLVCPRVIFPEDYDSQSECETPSRGYLSDVIIQADGSNFKLYFVDPVRLAQTLADDVHSRPYFAEPGLVVLPEVTTDSIRKAVEGLWQEGYFQHLKPL